MVRYRKRTNRKWEPREKRLVSEFCARYYEGHRVLTHVHLGSMPPRLRGKYALAEEEKMAGVWRRWADALIIMSDKVVIIEGKIKPEPGVISQISLYERIFPNTPEFKEHAHKPIEKIILCALEDPVTTQLAREQNIRVVVFRPLWVDDYLKKLPPGKGSPGSDTLE